jgi:Phosphotransferase enzyme family
VRTHEVIVDPDREIVVKRFVAADRGEPAREWRALTLLAEHAPGLAPEPIRADLAADPAVIEMSLLPGEPLGGEPVTLVQASALVRAMGQLWQSVPVRRVIQVPGEPRNEAHLVSAVTELAVQADDLGDDPLIRRATSAGLSWLTWAVGEAGWLASASRDSYDDPGSASIRQGGWGSLAPVFGQGDGNLANFLWDGERVRMVDFEDSGVADRAFELSVFIEHVTVWSASGLDADEFIRAFELTAAERARLADCRRLAALYWLLRLPPGGDVSSGGDPGLLRPQAERLLTLL